MRRRIWIWLFLALCGSAAWAVQTRVLSIEELTTRANLVLRGRVQELVCDRTPEGRLRTRVTLVVLDTWKGTPQGATQTLVASGGVLGERRSAVPDQVEFTPGEEVVVFVIFNARSEAVCVGLDQGKFSVLTQPGRTAVMALNRYHPAPGTVAAATQPAAATPSKSPQALPLDELARRVKATTR